MLLLIGRGLQTKEIANILRISPNTISNYRKALCKKLAVHSTAHLAAIGNTVQDTMKQRWRGSIPGDFDPNAASESCASAGGILAQDEPSCAGCTLRVDAAKARLPYRGQLSNPLSEVHNFVVQNNKAD